MTTQTEQFTVQIRTDKAAALLAGLDHYGTITVTVNPSTLTERQRQTLAALDFRTLTSYEVGAPIAGNEPIEDLLDRAADMIDAKRATLAREDADCIDSEIKRLLSCPLADGLSVDAKTGLVTIRNEPGALVKINGARIVIAWLESYGFWRGQACDNSPRALAIRRRVLADPDVAIKIEQAERTAALLMESLVQAAMLRKARMEEQAAEQERIAADRKARMKVQLAAFVAEHMEPLQQRRFEAGLMSNTEIIEGIEAQAFARLADWTEFECIRKVDVIAHTEEVLGAELDLDSDAAFSIGQRKASALTDAEFEQLEGIRAMLPDAHIELVQHWGYLDQFNNANDPEWTVNVARIELVVGDVLVSRDYVLNAPVVKRPLRHKLMLS